MTPEQELYRELMSYQDRPLDFVYWGFPWGEPGTVLENETGPDEWQIEVLGDLQAGLITVDEAWRIAIRSGHGVGKSAFFSWLVWWGISTMENTRGRVTANTKEQLMRVLWGEVSKWHQLFIAKHLFKVTATAVFSVDEAKEKTWRIDAIPWSKENSEAFAGLHNYGSRIIILCDEASSIEDVIWEVLDGATTDARTQIIWAVAGNPTRNYGRFKDCWGKFSSQWHGYVVDARKSKMANPTQHKTWASLYGEDSDFFRVRVRGEFPNAATSQLIPVELIRTSRVREVQSQSWEPLVFGVDVARYGSNETVVVFRRGRDARTMPASRWRGLSTVETGTRVGALIKEYSPDGVFIDEGGVGGGVVDFVRHLGHHVTPVNFGSSASTRPSGVLVGNKRAEMYVLLRDWLREGGCIPDSTDWEDQLISIEYLFNKKQEIMLLSKEDMKSFGVESPDIADALALTFAYPVSTKMGAFARPKHKIDYDPFGPQALPNFTEPQVPGGWQ